MNPLTRSSLLQIVPQAYRYCADFACSRSTPILSVELSALGTRNVPLHNVFKLYFIRLWSRGEKRINLKLPIARALGAGRR